MAVERILLELNQYCNLRCVYCFYNDIGRSENELTADDIKVICRKYSAANVFFLTGGECTLNPDFVAITEYLSSRGNVTVFTNGLTSCNESIFRSGLLFGFVDKIVVTYDSINMGYRLRGNVEDKVLVAIKKLVKMFPEKVEVKICVNRFNVGDFAATLKGLVSVGVEHFSVNFIKNICNSELDFQLKMPEIIDILSIAYKYKKYFSPKDLDFMKVSYESCFKNSANCIAGDKFIYIDCKREEFLCPCSPKKFTGKEKNDCFGEHCICIWELFR